MPVIIDELTADIAPPPAAPPASAPSAQENAAAPDPAKLRAELTRCAARAERIRAY